MGARALLRRCVSARRRTSLEGDARLRCMLCELLLTCCSTGLELAGAVFDIVAWVQAREGGSPMKFAGKTVALEQSEFLRILMSSVSPMHVVGLIIVDPESEEMKIASPTMILDRNSIGGQTKIGTTPLGNARANLGKGIINCLGESASWR